MTFGETINSGKPTERKDPVAQNGEEIFTSEYENDEQEYRQFLLKIFHNGNNNFAQTVAVAMWNPNDEQKFAKYFSEIRPECNDAFNKYYLVLINILHDIRNQLFNTLKVEKKDVYKKIAEIIINERLNIDKGTEEEGLKSYIAYIGVPEQA